MTGVVLLSEIAVPVAGGGMALHGTGVAFEGQGVVFFGPSGSGKSRQALALMAHGAVLVADDRVIVAPGPVIHAPDGAPALIEARFVGLLHADLHGPAPLTLCVDLTRPEPERLPPSRYIDCFGAKIPLILAANHPDLAPVIIQYLRKGRAQ